MLLNRNTIIETFDRNLVSNSNTMRCKQCYDLCANKEKLYTLKKLQNQVVFGRRGTGKTTIFKAFSYYINKVEKDDSHKAWYLSVDKCIPHEIEVKSTNIDDVIVFSVKKFLKFFLDFLYHEYDRFERNVFGETPVCNRKHIDSKIIHKLDRIVDIIIDLEDLIEIGSEITETMNSTSKVHMINGKKRETKTGISARLFSNDKLNASLSLKREIRKQNQKEFCAEKRSIYRIDINLIRNKIQEIFQEMGYSVVYICLDEFNQIDRNICLL